MQIDCAKMSAAGRHILLVDDDPLFLELTTSMLGNAGYVITSAASGAECLSALSSNQFALLIMDCGLQDPNELAILDLLPRLSRQCAVMILSSRSGDWHEHIMTIYGAHSIVSKTVDESHLLATVRDMLDVRGLKHG